MFFVPCAKVERQSLAGKSFNVKKRSCHQILYLHGVSSIKNAQSIETEHFVKLFANF